MTEQTTTAQQSARRAIAVKMAKDALYTVKAEMGSDAYIARTVEYSRLCSEYRDLPFEAARAGVTAEYRIALTALRAAYKNHELEEEFEAAKAEARRVMGAADPEPQQDAPVESESESESLSDIDGTDAYDAAEKIGTWCAQQHGIQLELSYSRLDEVQEDALGSIVDALGDTDGDGVWHLREGMTTEVAVVLARQEIVKAEMRFLQDRTRRLAEEMEEAAK